MQQPSARFCSNCGAPLSADARFCHVCGAAVVASPVAPNGSDAEAQTTTFVPPVYDPAASAPMPDSQQSWPTSAPVAAANASFGERAIALIIDWIILTLIFWIIGAFLAFVAYAAAGSSEATEVTLGFLVVMMVTVVHWFYFAFQESSARQATFGKRAMNIVVTDDHGNRLTFARASGRAFARLLSSLFFSLGYLMALFTARKQALHDLIASTIVVRR